ncbi:MAG: archaemetzincin family Zn-dependent metalloprotease [Desulfobacteraceae bacterium]|nr:archaemetzincin family Zn-dependent metalloprotease [Desulfobacteraceae bacterium]MCF8095578.1 archaemetzincin family Zn-dependent metalloprotease [Desulfobacteraceae bacterium]
MILLIPIGPVPIYLISWLEDKLGLYVNHPVKTGKAVPLPRGGYDPDRKQYKGDSVIELLCGIEHHGAEGVVGLIDQDCYTPGLNFIFGQAVSGGREAFVALPRLRPPCPGMEEDKNLFKERVLKEIVHELGHTWNLPHCEQPGCVMRFSDSVKDADEKNSDFCDRCKEKLAV